LKNVFLKDRLLRARLGKSGGFDGCFLSHDQTDAF
jgi:hypothetical protein